MKNIFNTMQPIRTIAVTLLISLFSSYCTKPRVPIVDITILRDITDEGITYTSYGEIREIFDFKKFLYYSHRVQVRELSDVRTGVSTQSILPEASETDIPENRRKPQVRSFLSQTEKILEKPVYGGAKVQSHLAYGIATEVNRLATSSTATNRILIVNSNLLENNEVFSIYREEDKQLLFEHPDSVIRIFEKEMPLQNLNGVRVYFVHHSNPETDYVFSEMTKLYTYYLGLKGAKVEVVANFISANIQSQSDQL